MGRDSIAQQPNRLQLFDVESMYFKYKMGLGPQPNPQKLGCWAIESRPMQGSAHGWGIFLLLINLKGY